MEPGPGAGSGNGGRKVAVWMGEGVELHGPAEQVGAVGEGVVKGSNEKNISAYDIGGYFTNLLFIRKLCIYPFTHIFPHQVFNILKHFLR